MPDAVEESGPEDTETFPDMPGAVEEFGSEDSEVFPDLPGGEDVQSFEDTGKAEQYVPRTVIKEAEYEYYLVESGAVIG